MARTPTAQAWSYLEQICSLERKTDLLSQSPALADAVTSIAIPQENAAVFVGTGASAPSAPYNLSVCVYRLDEEAAADEMAEAENISAAKHWTLPSREFAGLWDSLIYDSSIKQRLLDYVAVAMMLSDRAVDDNLVSFNRVVLLHGPPGTGKTSLCKALAQKLAIRMSNRYRYGQLIEINAHSLFSKWFSESGKLVMKLFATIREMIEDDEAFVCVLIDEVESLTTARTSALNGAEPSDSIRVVNALLTQIDAIKDYKNVCILTTSNITGAIDLAFVDRADIKQYIGLPSERGRYMILRSSVLELMRVGIVDRTYPLMEYDAVSALLDSPSPMAAGSLVLRQVAAGAESLSGRALRKLPVLALIQAQVASMSLVHFANAMLEALRLELHGRSQMDAQ